MLSMKILGLIVEYNPFHNGHHYHLQQSKKYADADFTVAIMSGHFLQRGVPALQDKWTRAQQAIDCGVDLVIELPLVYSLNSAEYFAHGAIKLLDRLNIIDEIIFGSEDGSIDHFLTQGKVFAEEPPAFVNALKKYLNQGLSFPKARANAFQDISNQPVIDNKPNNILGVEYAKAIVALDSDITLQTIKRQGTDYFSDTIESISSATAIRQFIKNHQDLSPLQKTLPQSTYNSLINYDRHFVFRDDFEDLIFYKLRTIPTEALAQIHDVNEGLENRIVEMAIQSNTLEELIINIKTKRYTYTRIQRILFKALFNIQHSYKADEPRYVRFLGFNQKGMALINRIKENSPLEVITNLRNFKPKDSIARRMIDLDINATNIYQLFSTPQHKRGGQDYFNKPIIKTKN
jgi:predicted nucleotidyltransferase